MSHIQDEAQEVYDTFSRTIYGKGLSRRARYERFRPGWYSVKYWERLLGPDVNNLHHMRRTMGVARRFVKSENGHGDQTFSRREAALLAVTAALHDQAESIVGDIPYGRKSGEQRLNEINTLKEYEAAFVPLLGGPALELYRIGRDRIAFGDESEKLASAFKTIELIGFMQNAFDALRRIDQLSGSLSERRLHYLGITGGENRDELSATLKRLSTEVLSSGVVGSLIEAGERFPAAHTFLFDHAQIISSGMSGVKTDSFDWYTSGADPDASKNDSELHAKSFRDQKSRWEQWTATQA